jgi:hypothetical protein
VSFGFLLAGFLATANAGRVAVAVVARRDASREASPSRDLAVAMAAGAALIVVAVLAADPLLDALDISPESWRIAAAIVLGATAIRTIVWPAASGAPLAAVLITPELAAVSVSFGADDSAGKVLAAAALALLPVLLAARARRLATSALAAQFLAALQIVVAIALAVSGIRDV